MKNEDIEILEDFSDTQVPNNNSSVPDLSEQANPSINQGVTQVEVMTPEPTPVAPMSEFDKMINEAAVPATPVEPPKPEPVAPAPSTPAPNLQSYETGFVGNDYAKDANNNLVQSTEVKKEEPRKEDLTITAVYPNGFAVDQNEELENTQVIKPKKKKNTDLPLIIIVAVLAITLVVLLIVFYL